MKGIYLCRPRCSESVRARTDSPEPELQLKRLGVLKMDPAPVLVLNCTRQSIA